MRTLTRDSFIDKVRNVHGDKFDYSLTEYVNCRTKVTIKCLKHGEFTQLPTNHWQGSGCPKCKAEITSNVCKYTTDKFIDLANIIHKNLYDYSDFEYINSQTKGIIKCFKHGKFKQTPANHLQGQRCPKCALDDKIKKQTITHCVFKERSKIIHNNKYDYSETNYIHGKIKSKIKCPIHGEFWQTPNNHLNGHGCPSCKSSTGEEIISKILTNNNLYFIREYRIPEQIYNYRYDFYLPEYKLFIEFHGIQHYEYIPFFHRNGEDDFITQKERDIMKKELVKMLKMKIIYFSYKDLECLSETEIEDRLTKYLATIKHSRITK